MELTPPKNSTWWIALILGVVGVLAYSGSLDALSKYALWLVVAGLVLMLVATRTKRL